MAAEAERMSYVGWYEGERKQTWCTPPEMFDALNSRFRFTLDGAASPHNALLPKFSAEHDEKQWDGERVFCNPPWSNIPPFIEKAAEADAAVLLVPARTNSRWFHRALELGARVDYFKSRPKFVGAKNGSPVDCLLLLFGDAQ